MNVPQDDLYKRGWVKLSYSTWYGNAWNDLYEVTQRQLDTIYDWHEDNKINMDHKRFKVK